MDIPLESRVENILQGETVKPRSRVEKLLVELIAGGGGSAEDIFVDGGSLEYVTVADMPYIGAQVGDPYIDLVLNNDDHSHIYIPVKDLLNVTRNRTVTLSASGWSNNTQTVNVAGIKADETAQLIQVVPASASKTAYENAGVQATGQGAGTLTFSCETVPNSDLTVYVVITEVVTG